MVHSFAFFECDIYVCVYSATYSLFYYYYYVWWAKLLCLYFSRWYDITVWICWRKKRFENIVPSGYRGYFIHIWGNSATSINFFVCDMSSPCVQRNFLNNWIGGILSLWIKFNHVCHRKSGERKLSKHFDCTHSLTEWDSHKHKCHSNGAESLWKVDHWCKCRFC